MKKLRKVFLIITACALMILTTACGKEDNTPFTHGKWNGSTYTSEFLGMKAEFGADWTVTSDADIAKAQGISDMSDGSIQSAFEKTGTIMEMMATNSNSSSVNIMVQDMEKTGVKMSEDDYFKTAPDLLKSQFTGVESQIEEGKVDFLGKSTRCLNISLTASGVTVYEIQIPVFKSRYVTSITFASQDKDGLDSIISLFTSV